MDSLIVDECDGGDQTAPISQIKQIALDLNRYAALLNGIEAICKAEDIGGDALYVAGTVCRQINHGLCGIADKLDATQREGSTS